MSQNENNRQEEENKKTTKSFILLRVKKQILGSSNWFNVDDDGYLLTEQENVERTKRERNIFLTSTVVASAAAADW